MELETQKGFSLIEVLVSLCLLSLGILSAAGMQLVALTTTKEAGFHALAAQLASDIAAQIRVQRAQDQSDEAYRIYLSEDYSADEAPAQPATSCYGLDAVCNSADLAKFNLYEWERKIKETLPKGRLMVCRDSEPWDSSLNEYKWPCSGAQSSSDPIVVKIGWYEKNAESVNQARLDQKPNLVLVVGL